MTDEEIILFRTAVREINNAYEKWIKGGNAGVPLTWPKKLRIKAVQGARGIFEMTWSFSGPDGRATFEYFDANGEPGIRWRRIGDHSVLKNP